MIANVLRFLCRILFRVEVHGLKNVPSSKYPLLIVANHQSYLDGLLLGLFLPKRATFVVKTGVLKNWFFRQFLKLTPHLSVDPTSPLAIKKVIKKLRAGENVVIFPEGRITLTGSLMKVYDGPGYIALKTGAPILPVHIDGAAESIYGKITHHHLSTYFPQVRLTVLPTTTVTSDPDLVSGRLQRKHAGEQMRQIMQHLVFSSQQHTNFFDSFLQAIDRFGAKTPLIEDLNEKEENYKELLKKSLALGRIACKVSDAGEAVGVLMPNVTNTVALILGMSAFDRIPAMLNYTAGSNGIQNACHAAQVKTVISSRAFIAKAKLEPVIDALEGLNIIYLEDLRTQFGIMDKLWLMLFALHFPKAVMHKAKPDDTGVILFTSGSEGKPKGVALSHRNVLSNIAQINAILDFNPTDKFLMALPIFHAFGFTGSMLTVLNGIKIMVFPSPLLYKIIPETIYDKRCTVLFSTNTFLKQYAKFAHPYDFNHTRYVIAGAEKLNEEVRELYLEKFGRRILQGYGSTECSPVLAVNTPMANLNGSVGQFVPGLQYKCEPVPGIQEGGTLMVKGPNIMQGYYLYDNPGVLVPPPDGWYDTGDIVEVDEKGYCHIKGRAKRFAKVAGEMVSLETVEAIANAASPEHQHAAVTQPDPQRGEMIVLATTDSELKREHLLTSAQTLGSTELAIAKRLLLIDEVPVLGTGKTDYTSLKKWVEAQ